jgi:hypothetical protein
MEQSEIAYKKLVVRLGFRSKSTGKFKYRTKTFLNVKGKDYEVLYDQFAKECKAPRNHYLRTCSGELIWQKNII